MEPERLGLSPRERERLKVLHEVAAGHLRQVEAAGRLRQRMARQGDGGLVHGLRGRRSNRRLEAGVVERALTRLRRREYAGFGPTQAAEHLAEVGIHVSRERLRQAMVAAGLWRARLRKTGAVHVWRPRRPQFGELVMMDSSPRAWLEERGPACQLIALIDDATSRA